MTVAGDPQRRYWLDLHYLPTSRTRAGLLGECDRARIRFRVLTIAEFDPEFTAEDRLEAYHPKIKREHPRAWITIFLKNDSKEQAVSFLADRDDIETMKSFLSLGEKQLDALESHRVKE